MSEPKLGLDAALQGFGEAHTRADAAERRDLGERRDPLGDRGELRADPRAGESSADLFGTPAQPETSANPVAVRTGPGRPPGAMNRRTDALKRYILALGYKHPAVVLAHVASADPAELRRQMPGLKAGEAVGLTVRAAEALMPYFEQKLPTAIELPPDEGRPAFVFIDGEAHEVRKFEGDEEALRLDDALDAAFGEGEQNQQLSDDDDGRRAGTAPNDGF